MDASADDPRRYTIRRSPSIGSSAAPVTSGPRAGKRKLSTAAFGSSPSMASHPPSSPITSELPKDELKHAMQGASQLASTSRSTIESCDAGASDKALSSNSSSSSSSSSIGQQTPFADWQEQRRCHSILADYDYSPPTEDRRDPRSSNSCLVMPQPQLTVTSVVHDSHASETDPSSSLQPSSIPLHDDATAGHSTHGSCLGSRSSFRERQSTEPHAVQLQSSLSQLCTSEPPSPERGLSASPSYSEFDYQTQHPLTSQRLSVSVRQLRPSTAEQSPVRSTVASISDLTSSSSQTVPCLYPAVEPANDAVGSTSSSGASHLEAAPLQPDKSKRRGNAFPAASAHKFATSRSSAPRASFQLQPVPPPKRRRFEDVSPSNMDHRCQELRVIDEERRSSDAGVASEQTEGYARHTLPELPHNPDARGTLPQISPSRAESRNAPPQVESAASTSTSVAVASASDLLPNVVHGFQTSQKTEWAGHVAVSSLGGTKIDSTSSAVPPMVQPRKQQAPSPRSKPRLGRAQSVPNLRVKATLDVAAPSNHRLILPSNWASYVSSRSRHGREGPNDPAKGRSSKGFPFNVAHYPAGSNSSRGRSVFTPALHPPITRHTLRELDLFEILKNPQLRHDVVFDPNVQFRPNFDGERGRRKREAGERYWTAVVREIETGCTCTAFAHGQLLACTCKPRARSRKLDVSTSLPQSRIPSRIPLLVQELRTICLSILPSNYPADTLVAEVDEAATASTAEEHNSGHGVDSDGTSSSLRKKADTGSGAGSAWTTTHHQLIAQTLDPHLISQELQHGVLDVPALITFMGSILKLHCAPMRDEAIERMVEVVCVDRKIGKGLRLCFEILELMKLDIANHQLRSARPFLVETAVDFEVRWFKEQIEQGKMSLERTNAWMQGSLNVASSGTGSSRNEAVVKAFNQGMLQLVFDMPGTLSLASPVATPLGSPSSSSLNNTFASHYPETFQFDAYRMMTFHNDVSDLTIVYMLVLLFRQLCSTPLDGEGALPASTAGLVQKQLKAIKGEIWCLVNDANLCLSSSSSPSTTLPASSVPSPTRRTAAMDSKLLLGSASRFVKLDHPRWRRAMQNVLLQVAARAATVQMAARTGSSDPGTMKTAAPSAATQKLLNSWMDTNLRSGSALYKICQNRLRVVVSGMLEAKVRAGLQTPSTAAVPCVTVAASAAGHEHDRLKHKRAVPAESQEELTPPKKLKSDAAAAAPTLTPTEVSGASPWDAAMSRAGLEPFAAEVRLLSERIAKVAIFHLRVFRNLYEGIESGRPECVGGAQ